MSVSSLGNILWQQQQQAAAAKNASQNLSNTSFEAILNTQVGASTPSSSASSTASSTSTASLSTSATASSAQAFLNYMKETPQQHMEDAWLKQHGLTRDDLKNMTADQQTAIKAQMAADLKAQAQQDADAKKNKGQQTGSLAAAV